MTRKLWISYYSDGFYGTWEQQETDKSYLVQIRENDKTVVEKIIRAPAAIPVFLYAPEKLQEACRYDFELGVITEKVTEEYRVPTGIGILCELLEKLCANITENKTLVLNQELVGNEVWTSAWERLYGKKEILISNVQKPELVMKEGRLYLNGDGIQAAFYVEEKADLKQELCLQLDFWDLQQETEEKISQGTFLLEDAFEKVSGTNLFIFTKELGAFSQIKLLEAYSRLYCAGTVRREYCIGFGQKDAPLPLWKDKLELQSWSVVCRSQETLREKDTVWIGGIAVMGGFLLGQEKQAELSLHIGFGDRWKLCLNCGEGSWLAAISNLAGFPVDEIEKVITWIGEKTGDFSLDYAELTFSVAQGGMVAAEFALRQKKECNLFGIGIHLKNWCIMVNLVKEESWKSQFVLAGELILGSGEDAPEIFVSVPIQEECRQIVLSSGEKGIALPSIENLLKLVGIGDGSKWIPDELYNLDDYKISQLELMIDCTSQPKLEQYGFGISSQRELTFKIGSFPIKIQKVELGIEGKSGENPVFHGESVLVFQKLECKLYLQVECETKALQMSVTFTEEEAEQIAFDAMADGFVEEELSYQNLPLPQGFAVPVFEKAVLWADTGRQKYVMSGRLKNLGACIFETSLDKEQKLGYVLVAALDENFTFGKLSEYLKFIDSILAIRAGGIVLSTLNGRGIRDVMAELPPEIEAPAGLPQIDSEVKEGLFLYGKIELTAPVFQMLFGMAGEEKPVLETSLYFPKEKEELFIRVGLKEMSLFQLLYFRQMEFFCRIADGTRYGLNGNVYLAVGGQEYGFGFSVSGDTGESQMRLEGYALEPINLDFLVLTDTEHVKGPGISLELSREEKVLGLTGGILLFGEPFVDIKRLGYDFKKEQFLGTISYNGPVTLLHGNISFIWDKEKGIEIQEFPMHFLDEILDYAKLIEEASNTSGGACKKIAGLIFEKAVQTEFTITPSFGGMDEKGMSVELLPQYTVSVAGEKILTSSMKKLTVVIEKPQEIGFEALAKLVVDTILKNAVLIAEQIVNDVGNLTKLIAVMGTVQATEEAFGALLCRGGKETVKGASEVAKAQEYARAAKGHASGGGSLTQAGADAAMASGSAATAGGWLEEAGIFFGAMGAAIIIIGGGGSGKKDLEEHEKEVEKHKKEAEEAKEEAKEAVRGMLAIKELALEQQTEDTALLSWKPVTEEKEAVVEYHISVTRNGSVIWEGIETACSMEVLLEPEKENQFEIMIFALYRYDDTDTYQGETAHLSTVVGKSLKILEVSLPVAVQGEEYRYELKAEGGSSPYRWNAEGLPEGLTMQEQFICGIPKYGGGEVYVEVTVTDRLRKSVTEGYWLEVK